MEIVDPPDIAAAKAIHQPRGPLGAGRRQQEVDVVGHQDVGVDRATDIGGDLREIVEIGAPIGIVEEAGLAIDAALHEMDRHAGKHEARPARHPPMLGIRPRAAKACSRLTPICVWLATSHCSCRPTSPRMARDAGA
jgi:hypothetical protein